MQIRNRQQVPGTPPDKASRLIIMNTFCLASSVIRLVSLSNAELVGDTWLVGIPPILGKVEAVNSEWSR